MRVRAELAYAGIGLAGLALLAVSYLLRGEAPSVASVVLYGAAALVLVAWTVMGIGTARRRARQEAERQRRQAAEQVRKEAQDAARRAATVVNARRTTSLGGTTITVHRRGPSERGQGRPQC